jgi:hypothetical protein
VSAGGVAVLYIRILPPSLAVAHATPLAANCNGELAKVAYQHPGACRGGCGVRSIFSAERGCIGGKIEK